MALIIGRSLVALLGVRSLWRLRPSGVGPSAAAGLAFCVFTYAWATVLGARAQHVLILLGVLALVLTGVACLIGRVAVLLPRGAPGPWLGLAAVLGLAAAVALLPVLAAGGFAIANDTFIYSALSEWLQTSALDHVPRWEPTSPLTYFPSLWQGGIPGAEVREAPSAGAAYVLALMQAARGGGVSLLAFPATSALGFVTLAAVVWSLARGTLRLPVGWATATAVAFATMPHPLLWAHHRGFLQQALGLPLVFAAVALVPSAMGRRGRRPGLAILLGILLAGTASLYLVALPIALAALGAGVVCALMKARSVRRPPWGFVALALATALVLAPRDLTTGVLRIPKLAGIVAGWHVAWSPLDRWGYAFGLGAPGSAGLVDFGVLRFGGLLLGGMALLGLAALFRPRAWPLLGASGLLASLGLFFALAASDPWTGARGHSWNLTRVMQWAFPLTLLLTVAGLRFACRHLGARLLLPPVIGLGLAATAGNWEEARDLGQSMGRVFIADRPLRALDAVRDRLHELPEGQLLLVGRAANRGVWLGAYVCLIAWPRGVVGRWEGSGGVGSEVADDVYDALLPRAGQPGVVALGAGLQEAESDAFAPLGAGMGLLRDPKHLGILYVVRPRGFERLTADGAIPVDGGRTWLSIWSPEDARLAVVGDLGAHDAAPPSPRGVAAARLTWTVVKGDPPALKRSLGGSVPESMLAAPGPVSLPFGASAGLTSVVLSIDGLPNEWLVRDVHVEVRPSD